MLSPGLNFGWGSQELDSIIPVGPFRVFCDSVPVVSSSFKKTMTLQHITKAVFGSHSLCDPDAVGSALNLVQREWEIHFQMISLQRVIMRLS